MKSQKSLKKPFLSCLTGEAGQTSVEYILMIAVVAILIFSMMNKIRDNLLARTIPCPPEDRSLGCSISRSASTIGATDTTFRYFTLRR